MQKQTTIFADKDHSKKTNKKTLPKRITLSRDEYRQLIHDAYQEGVENAFKENENKSQTQQQTTPRKEAKQEAIKEAAQENEANKQRFETIVARQDIELLRAKTIFPFNIFPDTLIIDTTKITIARKQFFATEYVTTIPLKDLADVTVQTALFLASLIVKYMPQASSPGMTQLVEIKLTALLREDAFRAKNILKGALVAKAEEIDIAKLTPEQVKNVVEKFGQSEGIE